MCERILRPLQVGDEFHTLDKYAKTLEDIERLEDVIGLQKAVTAKEFQDQID